MPNHPVAISGAIIVVSVAVAAAIAVYESPQARQFAEDVRRRIAIALHSLGDEIQPTSREPRFNRPEDAHGFTESGGVVDPGMDADEESRKRQREEMMYWNHVRLEKLAEEKKLARGNLEKEKAARERGSSFDDFLQEDPSAEKGTFIYNTSADVYTQNNDGGLRMRGVRGLNQGSLYANPFSDENTIESDTQHAIDASLMSPEESERYEIMSNGLYSASEAPANEAPPIPPRPSRETTVTIVEEPLLIDTSDQEAVPDPPVAYPVMYGTELSADPADFYANMAAQDGRADAFASIHAWADQAENETQPNGFYSPLPTTPRATTPTPQHASYNYIHPDLSSPVSPLYSDPPVSVPSSGQATPTDSMSLAGSGFESAEEIWAPRSGATSEAGRDVISIDGEGITTPGSWSEVGSVVSENDIGSGLRH